MIVSIKKYFFADFLDQPVVQEKIKPMIAPFKACNEVRIVILTKWVCSHLKIIKGRFIKKIFRAAQFVGDIYQEPGQFQAHRPHQADGEYFTGTPKSRKMKLFVSCLVF